MSFKFTKMQALGNDFVVIDATTSAFSLSAAQIQQMGDRHLGVGFDQLLVLEQPTQAEADFLYRIFNADGGEVGQCGNGARCVALYIKERGLSDKDEVVLQTQDGFMTCRVLGDDRVSVMLPAPKFDPVDIPFDPNQPASSALEFTIANVGNPHALIIVEDVDSANLLEYGELLTADPRFPEGVNVSVMSIEDRDSARLRVYERGVGPTQACGSAACAAMVLGFQQGLFDQKVTILQPGGELAIAWQGHDSLIEMTGPAAFVFQGEYFSH